MTDVVHLPPYKVSFTYRAQSLDGVGWGVSSYGIPPLWRQTKGEGVTVAVVDSGIAKHTALNDVVVDYRNFTTDGEVHDTLGHGTHVAGIIAARSNVAGGIAPDAKLLSLKVLGHSGMGSNEGVSSAVLHAVDAGADIISMSLGSARPDDRLHQAIRHAHAHGIIVVCAAGHDGGRGNYPAAFQETIGVGAVDRAGNACEFSCRGKEIVVAAPGQDIHSTWLDNGYATLTGTSMAAPFVSGVLALYVSAQKRDGNKIDHGKVTAALQQTCKDAGAAGRDDIYGWGLVDPHKLLNYQVQSTVAGVTVFIPGARII